MQVKEFRQPTVREAFRAIREELGPDALVLASDMVSARGWRGWLGLREVRVTASAPAGPVPDAAVRSAVQPRRPADTPARPLGGLAARLVAAGVDVELAERVGASVPRRQQRGMSTEAVTRALAMQLTDIAAGDEPYAAVEVFVGPPGVGKTTTIAKIAAQERARRRRMLEMIAADSFRAGAIEQLRTYAGVIGAPFRVARSIEEMDQAIEAARHTLLVDTAGRSPKDTDKRDVRRLLGDREGVRTHLVIAADTSVTSAQRIFTTFADTRPDRVVLSRLDEAESPSALFTWLRSQQLPISYITTGQRVPEDLERATPALLAALLLRDLRVSPAGAA
jgi:flagellar biosynthesis protein FlhF